MSSDTILIDEDGTKYSYDNIKTQGWLNGQSYGAEQVCEWILNRSVEMFKDGRVEEAIKMRALAVEAKSKVVPGLRITADLHAESHPAKIGEED